jgi:hypothetical protein
MSADFDISAPLPLTWFQKARPTLLLVMVLCVFGWALKLQFFNDDASDKLNLDTLICPFDSSTTILPRDKGTPYGLNYDCADCRRTVYFLPKNEGGSYVRFTELLDEDLPALGHPMEMWEQVVRDVAYNSDDDFLGMPRDRWQTPKTTQNSAQGDCEDTSILLFNHLHNAGYKARVVVGQAKLGRPRWKGHAWVAYLDHKGETWVLETAQDPQHNGAILIQPIPMIEAMEDYRAELILGPTGVYVTERPAAEPYFSRRWRRTGS